MHVFIFISAICISMNTEVQIYSVKQRLKEGDLVFGFVIVFVCLLLGITILMFFLLFIKSGSFGATSRTIQISAIKSA